MDESCVSMSTVCDGKMDCENGRDEEHCSKWFKTCYKDFILARTYVIYPTAEGCSLHFKRGCYEHWTATDFRALLSMYLS